MLRVNNLKFGYDKKSLVLKDINFTVDKGKIYVLLGKNGAGKTTLLKCINDMYQIKSGTIIKNTAPIFIEDNPVLYYYLTGKEYIELILTLNDNKNQDLVKQLIKDLDMEAHLDKSIIDYSLGMKHKLALISAIMIDYELFLIDEPLTALDPDTSRFLIDYFKQMKINGKSLLISTHMMHVAYQLADEIFILVNGVIKSVTNDFTSFEAFENYVITELNVNI